MGECGCAMGNKTYKLKAPDGWYVFQMYPGCDYCDLGPGMRILMSETSKFYCEDELENISILPTVGFGKSKEVMTVIKCGLSKDQMANAAIKTMTGYEVEACISICDYQAEVLGEDLWNETMNTAPKVVLLGDKVPIAGKK